MKINDNLVSNNQTLKTTVCIVGAGAAGITLALELGRNDIDVILVESGGLEYEQGIQDLYSGDNIGHKSEAGINNPTTSCRLRYFGGTTNHWMGNCRVLDKIDFLDNKHVLGSGWPISYEELHKYYDRASQVCQINGKDYSPEAWTNDTTPKPFKINGDKLFNTVYQVSPPTRFGKVYRDELFNSKVIQVLLYSNATEINVSDNLSSVSGIKIKNLKKKKQYFVHAKHYIIAMGGIENARLLLSSSSQQVRGIGNKHDLVGRYYMEHPHIQSGIFLPNNKIIDGGFYRRFVSNNGHLIKGAMKPRAEQMISREMLNASLSLVPISVSEDDMSYAVSEAYASARYIRRALTRNEVPDNFWKHVFNVFSDVGSVAKGAYYKTEKINNAYKLFIHSEQSPNKNSRILLTNKVDQLGMPKVAIDWKLASIDIDTIRNMQELFALEMGQSNLGRVLLPDVDNDSWSDLIFGGCHHMGTTRMAIDPKFGVVDINSKVHGISNLWVAGSSVFPRSGSANPTLTIVALAIRLADHLKMRIKQ